MTASPNIIAISRQVYEYKADGDRDHDDDGDEHDVDHGRCASTRPPPSPCPAPAAGSNTHHELKSKLSNKTFFVCARPSLTINSVSHLLSEWSESPVEVYKTIKTYSLVYVREQLPSDYQAKYHPYRDDQKHFVTP